MSRAFVSSALCFDMERSASSASPQQGVGSMLSEVPGHQMYSKQCLKTSKKEPKRLVVLHTVGV